jgi:hypothetical protein
MLLHFISPVSFTLYHHLPLNARGFLPFAGVRNRVAAEDLVKATSPAALDRGESEDCSSEKTWLSAFVWAGAPRINRVLLNAVGNSPAAE